MGEREAPGRDGAPVVSDDVHACTGQAWSSSATRSATIRGARNDGPRPARRIRRTLAGPAQ